MLAKTYKIETERLIIRCYHPKDAVLLKKAVDDSRAHLLPWMPWIKTEEEPLETVRERLRKWRGQFDLGEDYTFGIFDKAEQMLLGSTGLHTRAGKEAREIGYWIHVHHIKQGYALEAAKALTKVGFEIEQLQRIQIRCEPNNLRSQNIPKKMGYTHEATLKNRITDMEHKPRDVMIWTLFKEDYEKSTLPAFPLKAFSVVDELITV